MVSFKFKSQLHQLLQKLEQATSAPCVSICKRITTCKNMTTYLKVFLWKLSKITHVKCLHPIRKLTLQLLHIINLPILNPLKTLTVSQCGQQVSSTGITWKQVWKLRTSGPTYPRPSESQSAFSQDPQEKQCLRSPVQNNIQLRKCPTCLWSTSSLKLSTSSLFHSSLWCWVRSWCLIPRHW